MRHYEGELVEIWHEAGPGGPVLAGRIACPGGARPAPGQYLLAARVSGPVEPLAATLFAGDDFFEEAGSFVCAPPLPEGWAPGDRLRLYGPLGKGFALPANARRVALAALGGTSARLLPLVAQALRQGAAVTLFQAEASINMAEQRLPAAVEVNPLDAFPDALAWADYMAIDLPLHRLREARARLHLDRDARLPAPAQALVHTAMPCGGAAECGVCAVRARSGGWLLACKDGPVFNLNELEW